MNNNNEIWVFLSHSHEDYEKVRKVQSKPGDVTKSDSFRRKLLLSPTKEIKDALNATPVRITCCDREGDEGKTKYV